MLIKAIYYLAYPDTDPPDPEDAESEVRVEVGEEGSPYDFDHCYALRVMTLKRLANVLTEAPEGCLALDRVLVVKRFEDSVIHEAIRAILSEIEKFALLVE